MIFENGKCYHESIVNDLYMKGFLGSIFLKESCFDCKFRNSNTDNDLILGDYWGAEVELPTIDDNNGLSAIIANTWRGLSYIHKCDLTLYQCKLDSIKKYNPRLVSSPQVANIRHDFYLVSQQHGYETAINHFLSEKFFKKLTRHCKFFIRCACSRIQRKKKPLY